MKEKNIRIICILYNSVRISVDVMASWNTEKRHNGAGRCLLITLRKDVLFSHRPNVFSGRLLSRRADGRLCYTAAYTVQHTASSRFYRDALYKVRKKTVAVGSYRSRFAFVATPLVCCASASCRSPY